MIALLIEAGRVKERNKMNWCINTQLIINSHVTFQAPGAILAALTLSLFFLHRSVRALFSHLFTCYLDNTRYCVGIAHE